MVSPKQKEPVEHIESPEEIEDVIEDLFDGVTPPEKLKVVLDEDALTPDSGDVTNDSSSGYQHKDRRALLQKFMPGRGGGRHNKQRDRGERGRRRWGRRR